MESQALHEDGVLYVLAAVVDAGCSGESGSNVDVVRDR
jgi:hypothetical protein